MSRIIADRPAAHCAVLVLAAGASRRLGRPKPLVTRRGRTLVEQAATLALALRPAWVGVVVGAGASRVAVPLRGLAVEVIHARRWRDGMAESLAAGVRRIPRRASHLLVLTVDQWAIAPGSLAALLRHRAGVPVAAHYAGRAGVPAVFPRRDWPALKALRGDRGARQLLERAGVIAVPMPSAAHDLDERRDLARYRRAAATVRQAVAPFSRYWRPR